MSDFDDVLEGTPAEQEPVEQQEEQQEPEQQEATAETPPEETPEPPEQPQEQTVPLAVFKSMRDDLKSQIDSVKSQLNRPAPEPVQVPDVIEDPQEYHNFVAKQIADARTSTKLEMSHFMAEREFGKEAVDEVVEYFEKNPQLSHQFLNTPSPFHAAKEYVDAQKTAKEIGKDPAAYEAKIEAKIRAKIEAELAAKQAQEMAAKAAPSLANTNGSGGKTDPGWAGPTDLTSLIGE